MSFLLRSTLACLREQFLFRPLLKENGKPGAERHYVTEAHENGIRVTDWRMVQSRRARSIDPADGRDLTDRPKRRSKHNRTQGKAAQKVRSGP
ncbi:putative caspase-like protein [Aquamicrobium terrae]|uniref:Caspase-like protein n=1 Tax=Aquamicrobium terrae TaxID=1324945 RepID=A0ABV2N4F6_9HYPH